MKKQVSALNTIWIVRYLRSHYPHTDIDDILQVIARQNRFYIEDLKTGGLTRVRVEHLENQSYWFSNLFMMALYREIESRLPVPRLGYEIGKSCHESMPFHRVAILAPFLGPRGVLRRIVEESKKYNRTKQSLILADERGYARVRLIHHEGIRINDFAMDWHAGVFFAYGKVSGAKDLSVTWTPRDSRYQVVDFDIHYSSPNCLRRVLLSVVFNLPPVKTALAQAEAIQAENREQLLGMDALIKEKTGALLRVQNELLQQERLLTEQHLAGGMAHEIRNALGAAKLRLKDLTLSGEIDGNAASLYDLISRINRSQDIPDAEKSDLLPLLRRLSDHHGRFAKAFRETSAAIDRGLKITNRVMRYSSMHHAAGESSVALKEIVETLSGSYQEGLAADRIEVVNDISDGLTVRGNGNAIHALLQNLFLNARDAIREAGRQHGRIRFYGRKQGDRIVLEVEDNGVGIPEENREKIFQPFFSTKPALGMGLGLSESRKVVVASGGRITMDSTPGKGSRFKIEFILSAETADAHDRNR